MSIGVQRNSKHKHGICSLQNVFLCTADNFSTKTAVSQTFWKLLMFSFCCPLCHDPKRGPNTPWRGRGLRPLLSGRPSRCRAERTRQIFPQNSREVTRSARSHAGCVVRPSRTRWRRRVTFLLCLISVKSKQSPQRLSRWGREMMGRENAVRFSYLVTQHCPQIVTFRGLLQKKVRFETYPCLV